MLGHLEICAKCEYRKEKWIETREEGTTFTMFDGYYCPLNECMYSDYPEVLANQYDNMTGTMNL